jgi:GNAT superfamily N-acetyltransferase
VTDATADNPAPQAAGDRLEIRLATSADADVVADVFLGSIHATYTFPLAHTDDECRGWIREHVGGDWETWVAVEAGRVVAMTVVRPGHLDHLYVAPDRLGSGIGRRLLDTAKQRSPRGLTLATFQVNDRARRFYERNGFVAEAFGDGSGNEERQPDVHYAWHPASVGRTRSR